MSKRFDQHVRQVDEAVAEFLQDGPGRGKVCPRCRQPILKVQLHSHDEAVAIPCRCRFALDRRKDDSKP